MAYISQEIYDRRRESAAQRMVNNAEVNSLTSDQHELIAEVCTMRHNIHCAHEEIYNGQSLFSREAMKWLEGINSRLVLILSPIKYMPSIEYYPSAEDRYCGVIDEEEEEENKEKFYNMMRMLNSSIEEWLSSIDKKHRTNYAPTG